MRTRVTFFVSYARANKRLAARFLARFEEQARPSKRHDYRFWRDGDIPVGERWHEEIRRALDACDLGLLLVSPAFLASRYVTEHELPRFVGTRAKPMVPVMLQAVDLELHDLKGLEEHQIFRLEGERFKAPKAYGDCTGPQRERFAAELFRQVERKLDPH